jgi:hypothetical protein
VDGNRGRIIVVIVLVVQGGSVRVDRDTAEDFRRRIKTWIAVGIGENWGHWSGNHMKHRSMRHMLDDPRRHMHARG